MKNNISSDLRILNTNDTNINAKYGHLFVSLVLKSLICGKIHYSHFKIL